MLAPVYLEVSWERKTFLISLHLTRGVVQGLLSGTFPSQVR